jgi:hypothetical protein
MKNKIMRKFLLNIFLILSAILAASIIVGCAIRPNFPSVPFAAHKAGSTIVQEVKLDHDIVYAFYLMLYHENTKEDAERVRKLAGSGMHRKDKSGNYVEIQDGIPVYVALKITGVDDEIDKIYLDKQFSVNHVVGGWKCHDSKDPQKNCFVKGITGIRLKPGRYRITLKSLQDIPELEATTVALWFDWGIEARPNDWWVIY